VLAKFRVNIRRQVKSQQCMPTVTRCVRSVIIIKKTVQLQRFVRTTIVIHHTAGLYLYVSCGM